MMQFESALRSFTICVELFLAPKIGCAGAMHLMQQTVGSVSC